jgi:hypothetical protein
MVLAGVFRCRIKPTAGGAQLQKLMLSYVQTYKAAVLFLVVAMSACAVMTGEYKP